MRAFFRRFSSSYESGFHLRALRTWDPEATSARFKGKPFIGVRGGNGHGLSSPQTLLLESLGEGWCAEYIVFAKGYRPDWPLMRVDVAFPSKKIAVECDGQSHNSPKARIKDAKKDSILTSLGWVVLRFKNKEVLNGLAGIVDFLRRKSA